MSQPELWAVIGRANVDNEFREQLFHNFRQVLAEQRYQLDDKEIETAKQVLSNNGTSVASQSRVNSNSIDALSQSMPGSAYADSQAELMRENLAFENKLKQDRMTQQIERIKDLSSYTVDILKNTLGNAARTYKTISAMNVVMFAVGIMLFVFAAFYAAFSKEKIYSLIFGGLGTVSFITLFLLGSIEKSQNALSNLVQVEVSFMSYFEQITFWETFAFMPQGYPPVINPANIEKASAMLQERSQQIVDMLQKYIETKDNSVPNSNQT